MDAQLDIKHPNIVIHVALYVRPIIGIIMTQEYCMCVCVSVCVCVCVCVCVVMQGKPFEKFFSY